MKLQPLQNIQKSILFGLGYGLVRKTFQMTTTQPEYTLDQTMVKCHVTDKYVFLNRNRPLLLTEKALVIGLHAGMNIAFYPFYIANDLICTEAMLRGCEVHGSTIFTHTARITLLDHVFS